ncbi:MAG: thiamine phosphate synthase [Blastocatellia bacterium]|nr:thiamine phosphate synthase [Blastocatellia bacterium]
MLYLISDRRALFLPGESFSETTARLRLLKLANAAAMARIPYFQLREKDLEAREVFELADEIVRIFAGTESRLLLNDRFDIALAAGAHGVHLTTRSLPAYVVRQHVPSDFLIGVSTHNQPEIRAAEQGADFLVCGPVFDMPTKSKIGLEQFSVLAASTRLPVFALGGITVDNLPQLARSGAAGIASIRLFCRGAFEEPAAFTTFVSQLRIEN